MAIKDAHNKIRTRCRSSQNLMIHIATAQCALQHSGVGVLKRVTVGTRFWRYLLLISSETHIVV
jgi:hypothetical protein